MEENITVSPVGRKMSPDQMEALKWLVAKSKDIRTVIAKQAIIWLLQQTDGLTKSMVLNISGQYPEDALYIQYYGVHHAMSMNGSTHINEILKAMGSSMKFSHIGGCFIDSRTDKIDERGSRVWIGEIYFDKEAYRLSYDPETIQEVRLPI